MYPELYTALHVKHIVFEGATRGAERGAGATEEVGSVAEKKVEAARAEAEMVVAEIIPGSEIVSEMI